MINDKIVQRLPVDENVKVLYQTGFHPDKHYVYMLAESYSTGFLAKWSSYLSCLHLKKKKIPFYQILPSYVGNVVWCYHEHQKHHILPFNNRFGINFPKESFVLIHVPNDKQQDN